MARRRKITIDLKTLKTYPLLLKELESHPDYTDKDLTSLNLTVYDNFEPGIKDVDKAILRLKRYVAANKQFITTFKDEQIISRSDLSKMLGITRQTLTKWIRNGFITTQKSKYISTLETFNTDMVLKELEDYKKNRENKS